MQCPYAFCAVLFIGINSKSTKSLTDPDGEKTGLSTEFKVWQSRGLLCKFQDKKFIHTNALIKQDTFEVLT